jgi:hypothetical protein
VTTLSSDGITKEHRDHLSSEQGVIALSGFAGDEKSRYDGKYSFGELAVDT